MREGKKVEESKAGRNYRKLNMMMKRIPRALNENISKEVLECRLCSECFAISLETRFYPWPHLNSEKQPSLGAILFSLSSLSQIVQSAFSE